MKRRIVAAVTAVLLAVVGGALLLNYVSSADERAMAGVQTVNVLVVTAPVPKGTATNQLTDLITVKALPAVAVASGAVSQLAQIKGLVANTDLQPGEQLLTARFSDPTVVADTQQVQIPKGTQEVSILLEPQRVLGGNLVPGDTVGVFVSTGGQTHLSVHKVMVTKVQGGIAPAPATPEAGSDTAPQPVPEGNVMVTLTLTAPNAEKVVFAAESAKIWLSLENAQASESGTKIVTKEDVYK